MAGEAPTYDQLRAEVAALRERVAEIERDERGRAVAIENALDGIALLDAEGRYVYMNQAHAAVHGYDHPDELIGRPWSVVVPDDLVPIFQREYMPVLFQTGRWRGEVPSKRRDGSLHPTEIALSTMDDGGLVCIIRDLEEQKRAEAERERLREEIIAAQQAALAELSTPLIPITDEVLVMPLIGSLDSRRSQQVIETLLEGIAASRARVAILDITGVPVVDTHVAGAILRAAQAVQLLGAQTVLTGIRPEVAQMLVALGADMRGIVTRGTLQSGIAFAIGRAQ